MKNIITIITLIFVLTGCKKLEDLNVNTKDFAVVPGEAVFTGAVRALANQMLTCNVNNNNTELFVQYWTETTYTDESRYDMVTRPVPANHMNAVYRTVLMDLVDAKRVLEKQSLGGIVQAQRDNQLAEIEIMTVFAMSNIVETFGDMPYSDAFDFTKPTPKYDDGLTIYKDLIDRLNNAITKLDVTVGGMGSYDKMYSGNVASTAKWKKFANTLKLRMGLMLADIPSEASLAKTTVESAASGVFVSGDKAAVVYTGDYSVNTHPIYVELVSSGRSDFVASNTFVNTLNALNDPRRPLYMTTAGTTGNYIGGTYGEPSAYATYSHVNPAIVTTTREGLLMDYAEAEFLLAEAAERGYSVTGTAETHYNNAVTASIVYWGGTAADAATYLAQPSVAYTTATGPWQQKIGTQAWIAYWYRGFTAWTTWRRLDYPRLVATPKHVADVNGIPYRYSYAVSEQTLNGDNYKAASAAIGGDNAMTPLFWDKTQYNTLTGN